jgi:hypothetical protein
MPSNPSLQACRNTVAPAGLTAQKLFQPRLALAERPRPQIFAIEFEQVEGVHNRVARLVPAVECIEHRDALRPAHYSLPVDRERPDRQLRRSPSYRRIPV